MIQLGGKSSVHTGQVESQWSEDFSGFLGAPEGARLLTTMTKFRESEFELLGSTGFTLDQTLHGEQRYEWLSDAFDPSAAFEFESEIVRHDQRANARTQRTMHIVTMETSYRQGATRFLKALTTFIFL